MYRAYSSKQNLICFLSVYVIYLAASLSSVLAQTAPISSSGLNTQISGPIQVGGQVQYDVTGGTRPNGGLNLFHSFGEFGVPDSNIANFRNDSGLPTSNILGRVTGGNISNIFGTIQTSDFASANLFLMNPAGFLFGPNATISVGGMVSFTSADYLKFEDGKTFNAIPGTAADALLAASPVAAFGFLGANPGAITVQGSELKVTDGASISLVGGNIIIESSTLHHDTVQRSHLSAPNGTIQLASAAYPGEFDVTLQPVPNLNGSSFTSFGTVTLASDTAVNVSGTDAVSIRGGQFVVSVSNAVLTTTADPGATNTISLRPGSIIAGQGGNITLQAADQIQLANSMVGSTATPFSNALAGDGGSIHLNSLMINLQDSLLNTSTLEASDAGNILLEASRLDVNRTEISTATQGPGRGGNIIARGVGPSSVTQQIIISEGVIRSESLGLLGNEGDAGNIVIGTDRFIITKGSLLATGTTASAGHAGNIEITASDSVSISGSSVIDSSSTSSSMGNAGQISIRTPTGSVLVDGVHSGIFTDTQAPRAQGNKGGNIVITASAVTLQNGGTLSAKTSGTAATATGGTILIHANTVNMTNGAVMTADSAGGADAGNINVIATDGLTMRNSSISTLVESNGTDSNARGGDIKITTSPTATVYLRDNSVISASVPGRGDGGNVSIDPQFVVLQNSKILAQTDQGTGGNIRIIASVFQPDATSVVNADADRGVNGTVTIQSPNAPASGKIQPLGNRPLQVTSLLAHRCAALAGGQFSSFTVAGRDSLPPEPAGWLSSPFAGLPDKDRGMASDKRGEDTKASHADKTALLQLRQIAPPRFLTNTTTVDRSQPCRS